MPKEKKKPVAKKVDGIWLSFIPVMTSDEFGDDIVDELKIHLINKTEIGYKFKYLLSYSSDKTGFELSNQIHSFEDFYIHDIPFENFNDGPVFSIEFSLLTADKKKETFF